MKKKPAAVANLQVTYKRVPIDSLFEDPANARKHGERNLETISNSLRCFGQVESLVVQKSTGKVIGGNGRLRVMKDLGWDEVDIAEVDITDVQSVSLGIALNRTAELAEWDDEILAATLNGLALEEGLLEAAGYDEEELAEMLAEIDDAAVGEEPPESNYSEQYGVIVMCKSEADQEATFNKLRDSGYDCKVVTT
jgi:ParB-like chromosome segregation protein Spo0J